MKRILAHYENGIGDILLGTPALASLAKSGHSVDFYVRGDFKGMPGLFKDWPLMNKVSDDPSDFIDNDYDYYLMGWMVSKPLPLKSLLKTKILYAGSPLALRHIISDLEMNLNAAKIIDPDLKVHKDTYCGQSGRIFPEITKKTTVLFPGCNKYYAMKRWGGFEGLADRFSDVAVVGTEEDMNFAHSYFYPAWIRDLFSNALHYDGIVNKTAHIFGKRYNRPFKFGKHVKNYIGKLDLADTAALVSQAGLFIGNDGGITHVAAALDIPTVAVFGPTSINIVRSERKNILYISKGLDCQPCQLGGKYSKAWRHGYIGCPIGVKCFSDLSVEDVYQKSKDFLDAQKA